MTLIDMLVQPCVESAGDDTPPSEPLLGQCWIVGSAPVGAWAGAARRLAIWTASGWRFAEGREGLAVHLRSNGLTARFVDSEWRIGSVAAAEILVDGERVVGPQEPAVPDPTGGSVIDSEARGAIVALLTALRSHGLIAA